MVAFIFRLIKKIAVQESVKVSVLSRRDLGRKSLHSPGIEPGTSAWQAAMLTTIPTLLLKIFFEINKMIYIGKIS